MSGYGFSAEDPDRRAGAGGAVQRLHVRGLPRRPGIITRGQTEAARALDISPLRTFAVVILPQAIPRIIPALGNYLVSIMKDVPVLSVVSILEMLNVARIIGDRSFNYMVPLTLVGVLYLILTLVASAGVRLLDERLPKRGIPLR
ncbi:hypothetical protein CDEN61S_03254 [Castellaniella denitrificans]